MDPGQVHISVVIPVYGCDTCLVELHRRLVAVLEQIHPAFEILLVNDASPDDSWSVIQTLAAKDPRVKGLNLSRNFGQHFAIAAGVDYCSGDWLVVMDCDLQHAPEGIPLLYAKAREGNDVVFSRRVRRKDSFLKQLGGRLFIRALGYATNSKHDRSISNFSIVSRRVVERLREFREHNRSYPLFVAWLGFDPATVEIEHAERFAGKSTYTLSRQLRLAVESIVSQSDKPLRISIGAGFALSLGSLAYGAYLAIRRVIWAHPVEGWTSVIVSIYFVAGLLLANLGVIGLYIGRIFEETKARPIYVVKDALNLQLKGV
jgi:glycosyltransferase involved in cell wall biosynthesis